MWDNHCNENSLNKVKDMQVDLQYAEKSNYENIVDPYKVEIIKNVETIVSENYLYPVKTSVDFDMDSKSETFGQIKAINLKVSKKYADEDKIIVDKVKIQVENSDGGTKSGTNNNLSAASLNIKNSIAKFYDISPDSVNISE